MTGDWPLYEAGAERETPSDKPLCTLYGMSDHMDWKLCRNISWYFGDKDIKDSLKST